MYIVLKINRALRESKIDNRFSIFILGHTTHIKTIEDYAPPSGASPMTVSSFVSSLSSNQAGHLKEFCDCLPESEDIHPSIAIQNALLDIPPLIKKDKILKEYVIKKQPYSCTTFVHIVIYDDYHSIYFADYYIPF